MLILDRYILRNHIGPYFFGFSIITFVFVMEFIIDYIDMFIDKGVALFVVLEFFALSLGHMFALIIPMAVMPATLMAFGQLASDNEITAMKSMGISLFRMVLPAVAAGLALGGFMTFYNNRILPESNHRLMNLMIDIGKMRPTLEIRENVFSDAIAGYSILVLEKNDRTGEVKNVQIFERKGGVPTTIIASRGIMKYFEEESVLRFDLEDGEIHEMPDPTDVRTYRRTTFKQYTMNIKDADRRIKRSDRSNRSDREMSAGMMRERVRELEGQNAVYRGHLNQIALAQTVTVFSAALPGMASLARVGPPEETPIEPPDRTAGLPSEAPRIPGPRPRRLGEPSQVQAALENEMAIIDMNDRQISRLGVEIHKKYSIPASCVIFVLLGAPLAIRSGKKGMTMAIGFSILFFLIYYIFISSGEDLADRRLVEPWLSMWLPNIVLGCAAAMLLRSTARESTTINWDHLNAFKRWSRANT